MKNFLIFFSLALILNITNAKANDINEFNKLKNNFNSCTKEFETIEEKCPEKWKYNCYNILMEGNKITQKCYINIAKKLFFLYYNQDYNKTQKMFDNIADFTYKTHLYIYQENNYCQHNNCGTSVYLRSQYATTYAIKDYIDKTLITINNYSK